MAFIEPIDADGFGYWGPNVDTVIRQYLENPNAKVIIRVKSIRVILIFVLTSKFSFYLKFCYLAKRSNSGSYIENEIRQDDHRCK